MLFALIALFGVSVARLVQRAEKVQVDEQPALEVVSCKRLGMHHLITLSDDSVWRGRGSWWWHDQLHINPPAYVQHILCKEANRVEKEVYV